MAIYAITWAESGSGAEVYQTPTIEEFVCAIRPTGGDYAYLSTWDAAVACNLTVGTTRVASHGGPTGTVAAGHAFTASPSGATGIIQALTATKILLTSITGTVRSHDVITDAVGGGTVTLSSIPAGARVVAEGYDEWATGLSDPVTLGSDWVTDELHYVIIRAASDHEHPGKWQEPGGGFRLKSGITVQTAYVRLEDLAIKPYGEPAVTCTSATLVRIDRSVFDGNASGGGTNGIQHDSGELRVYNSAIYRFGNCGIAGASSGRRVVYNCTMWGNTQDGIRSGTHVRNTASGGNGLSDFTWAAGAISDYNASEDATATGTHSRQNVTVAQFGFVSTTAGSEDFHLSSASSYLYNRGQDLQENPDALEPTPAEDFERQERPRATLWTGGTSRSYDIGADERFIALNPGSMTFPYYLTPSGGDLKFVLTGNATAKGSGIVIGGQGVRLNLGGYILTFGNSTTYKTAGIIDSANASFYGELPQVAVEDVTITSAYQDLVVYNGTITQGVSQTMASSGLFINTSGFRIYRITTNMTGSGSPSLAMRYTTDFEVHDCAFRATWKIPEPESMMRRDLRAAIWAGQMGDTTAYTLLIHDNTIDGHFCGISLAGELPPNPTPPERTMRIYNNTIRQDGTSLSGGTGTNSIAVEVRLGRLVVEANHIEPVYGQGVHVVSAYHAVVRYNYIRVHQQHINWPSWGIELEESCFYAKVYGNVVYSWRNSDVDNAPCPLELACGTNTGCEVYQNTFESVCNGYSDVVLDQAPAAVLIWSHPTGNPNDMGCSVHDNVFISDSRGIFTSWDGGNGVSFRDNTWIRSAGSDVFHYWRVGQNSETGEEYTAHNIRFYDGDYGTFDRQDNYSSSAHPSGYVWQEHYSTLTINVTALGAPVNAHVLVTDPILGILLDADIGTDGTVSIDCKYIRTDSLAVGAPSYTHYGPLTVTVTYSGQQQTATVTYAELFAGAHTEAFTFGNLLVYGEAGSGIDAYTITHVPFTAHYVTYREAGSGVDDYAIEIIKRLLYNGTTYYVRMQSKDASGETSAWSAVAQFVMATVGSLAIDGSTYYVRIKARDEYGYESEWSAYGAGENYFILVKRTEIALSEAGSGVDDYDIRSLQIDTYNEAGSGSDAYTVRAVRRDIVYDETGSGADAHVVQKVYAIVTYADAANGADAYVIHAIRLPVTYSEAGSGTDDYRREVPGGPVEEIEVMSLIRDEVAVTSLIRPNVAVTSTVIS